MSGLETRLLLEDKNNAKNLRTGVDEKIDKLETSVKSDVDSLRADVDSLRTGVDGKIDKLETSVKSDVDSLRADVDSLRTGVDGQIDKLETSVKSDVDSLRADVDSLKSSVTELRTDVGRDFDGVKSDIKEGNMNLTSTLTAKMGNMASSISQNVSASMHNMGEASLNEVKYITRDAPFLSFSFLLNDQPTCGAAIVVPPAIDYLPEGNDDLLDVIRRDTTLRGHPVVGATHCITKLVGPAQVHYLTQVPTITAHPTFFSTYNPRRQSGPRGVGANVKNAIVLAFLPRSDFYCAASTWDDIPAGITSSALSFATWVHTLSVYTAHARKAAQLVRNDQDAQWRAALVVGKSIVTSNPMKLEVSESEHLHALGEDITLTSKEISFAEVASVDPATLSAAENRSIDATLKQYVNGKYDYNVAAIVSTRMFAPASTPHGTSGSPVYVFKHNYETGAMEVYQAGFVLGFQYRLQQTLVEPLWPTVGPMEELLRVAIAVKSWPVAQWRDCPLHRRVLQLGRAGAVDLSSDIEAQVRRIVHTAAACAPE